MRLIKWMVGVFVLMTNCVFVTEALQELKNLPKAELHLHLGSAFPKEYLRVTPLKM